MQPITIATRKSPLALWQANYIKNLLQQHHPQLTIQILGLTTSADKITGQLQHIGGKGLFVKELEHALYTKKADIAVHSMKDVPYNLPPELIIPAIHKRDNAQDVLITNSKFSHNSLLKDLTIGTGSPRRTAQLLKIYPNCKIIPIRGNIQTRIAKCTTGLVNGIILAAAGLIRMKLTEYIQHYFTIDEILPAAGQGALGIECRANDLQTRKLIAPLNDIDSNLAITAERAVCRTLQANCHSPIAAYASITNNELTCKALASSLDGKKMLTSSVSGLKHRAQNIGAQVGTELLKQGAIKLLSRT